MKKLATILFASFCISTLAHAEEQEEKSNTRMQALEARQGSIILKGYTPIGQIYVGSSPDVYRLAGLAAPAIHVNAVELRDPANAKNRATGISITVDEVGKVSRNKTIFIDSDEIPSLLAAIDYLAKSNKGLTSHSKFEASYWSKGGFRITVFGGPSNSTEAIVSAGYIRPVQASLAIEKLAQLRQLIADAQAKLGG